MQPLGAGFLQLLHAHVDFYSRLDAVGKNIFEKRMQVFLSHVKVTGVKTTVEELDMVLIAASAIIPVFGFPRWEYINLNEVLLYPGNFNQSFDPEEEDKNTLGLVGTGPYQNIMIISQPGLRDGFLNKEGRGNVGIHEFVHLIDKTDGAVDGIPEFLLDKQSVIPWLNQVQKEIQEIIEERSDINPYGATNHAEFFAVVSEYFFKRPDLLEANHPQLFNLLVTIFKQQPAV